MNARDLAGEFIRIFAADQANFPAAAVLLRHEQETEEMPQAESGAGLFRPHLLVFELTLTPIDEGGTMASWALNLVVETRRAEDITAAHHAALVERARRKFFGTALADLATAKAALHTAMAAGGKFTLRNYDHGADPIDPAIENTALRTVFPVRGIAVAV